MFTICLFKIGSKFSQALTLMYKTLFTNLATFDTKLWAFAAFATNIRPLLAILSKSKTEIRINFTKISIMLQLLHCHNIPAIFINKKYETVNDSNTTVNGTTYIELNIFLL